MNSEQEQEHEPVELLTNMRHQHAFVMVGREQLFGVHMTQYHCELHKYQIIIKFSLPPKIHQQFLDLRRIYPDDTFMLCNQPGVSISEAFNTFSIPELASGRVKHFAADIFQGIGPYPEEDAKQPHFFPWAYKYVRPAIANVHVTVERIVMFRPFDHHRQLPPYATYLLFGQGDEAHMTNLQTARLATGPFEPPAFGPDYDHVLSLAKPVDWLDAPLLEAGIVVTVPKIPLVDTVTGQITIPCKKIFAEGEEFEVVYRGLGPVKKVIAGATFLQCTAVCNGPEYSVSTPKVTPCSGEDCCHLSVMPRIYWVLKEQP
jgi:hypothetical protein